VVPPTPSLGGAGVDSSSSVSPRPAQLRVSPRSQRKPIPEGASARKCRSMPETDTWACVDCMHPVKPGPRGGIPERCADCEAARRAEWAFHHGPDASPAPRASRSGDQGRLCRRCGQPATSQRHHYCDRCRRWAAERRRKTSALRTHQRSATQRGYGTDHRRLRMLWAAEVARGSVCCGRCGRFIAPGSPWDLSHPDDDKTQALIPWHRLS
jgi:hypothetical protein